MGKRGNITLCIKLYGVEKPKHVTKRVLAGEQENWLQRRVHFAAFRNKT